jgi:hypothetical protein
MWHITLIAGLKFRGAAKNFAIAMATGANLFLQLDN